MTRVSGKEAIANLRTKRPPFWCISALQWPQSRQHLAAMVPASADPRQHPECDPPPPQQCSLSKTWPSLRGRQEEVRDFYWTGIFLDSVSNNVEGWRLFKFLSWPFRQENRSRAQKTKEISGLLLHGSEHSFKLFLPRISWNAFWEEVLVVKTNSGYWRLNGCWLLNKSGREIRKSEWAHEILTMI